MYTEAQQIAIIRLTSSLADTEIEAVNMPTTLPEIREDTLITFKGAMQRLHVSRSTLYRLMWSGQIKGMKIGSTWRFHKDALYGAIRPVEERIV